MEESKHIELNEAKWDKWAETYDGKCTRNDYLRNCQAGVISLMDIKENKNYLDIGCGTGWALGQIAKKIDGKGSFYGVDLSTKMIEKAKENFKDQEHFHFIKSNAESIPLDDNLFDIILCTNSFHHYLHPDKVMKEIFRLLKVGGRIYILDPTANFLITQLMNLSVKLFHSEAVRYYLTKEFEKLMIDAGLRFVNYEVIYMRQKVHIGEKRD